MKSLLDQPLTWPGRPRRVSGGLSGPGVAVAMTTFT